MALTRLEVDLHELDAEGLTYLPLAGSGNGLVAGQRLIVFQVEDNIQAEAYVVRIDRAHGLAWIRVNRNSFAVDTVMSRSKELYQTNV